MAYHEFAAFGHQFEGTGREIASIGYGLGHFAQSAHNTIDHRIQLLEVSGTLGQALGESAHGLGEIQTYTLESFTKLAGAATQFAHLLICEIHAIAEFVK